MSTGVGSPPGGGDLPGAMASRPKEAVCGMAFRNNNNNRSCVSNGVFYASSTTGDEIFIYCRCAGPS